uniref:26S proteasome regulatory subunit Rpn7 N-terminal domain-containing protein n=1 Tax=Aegilops tauschii TaxID=37682 RepID=N1QY49_AEGTA
MAYDEAKAREDTAFYREAALRINGRLGPTHLLDQDWVDSVNHRAEQRKENLETELEVYKTCLHGESIRICYNDLGDFYYSHGRLTEAFKSYIKTEEYFSASEHVVQMCMKAILISVELGHNVRVLNFVSKAQGCQDPLSPIAIAKLQAVAGLARLGRKEYKLAAQEFLETGPELGSNYSEVIAAQDVATYGSLCALAFLNYSDIKMKVIENAKFGSFLSLFPEIRGLVNDFYYSSSSSCKVGKRLRNSSRRSTCVKHLLDSWGGQVGGDGVLRNVVCHLQVEESRAGMAGRVGLVAVEAQPLAATLE